MSTTTIRIEDDLKARVAAAAQQMGKSAHAFIVDALAERVEQVEQEAAFHALADERWANIRTTGKTVEAMMAVRARFYACASKHGVAPGSSRPDRTPDDHYSAAMRHLGVIASGGYDLLIPDLDDPGTHLAAAMCRGLLALDGVSRG